MTTASERKALEAEKGYQSGVAPSWTMGGGTMWVSEQIEPNPDLRGLAAVTVWDGMARSDDQVGAGLRALRTPIMAATWTLEPTEGVSDEVMDFVRRNIGLPEAGRARSRGRHQGIVFREHLATVLRELPVFGHSVFEQVYAYSSPQQGGDGRLYLRKLGPRHPTTIETIETGEDGGLRAVRQAAPALASMRGGVPRERVIPVESLTFYCLGREGADWRGTSVLRQAYRPWFFKDRLERIGVQIVERNGMGVPVATYTQESDREDLERALSNLRSGASSFLSIPATADVKLMGVTGSTVDPLPQIKHYSQQISKALAQGFQDLGHDAGARSLGETFLEVALRASQEIADLIADTFTEHVIRDLVEHNFGSDAAYPVLSPGDIVASGTSSSAVLVDLASAGLITPDTKLEGHLRAQYGLPGVDAATARTQEPASAVLGLSEATEADKQLQLLQGLKELREARGHDY